MAVVLPVIMLILIGTLFFALIPVPGPRENGLPGKSVSNGGIHGGHASVGVGDGMSVESGGQQAGELVVTVDRWQWEGRELILPAALSSLGGTHSPYADCHGTAGAGGLHLSENRLCPAAGLCGWGIDF